MRQCCGSGGAERLPILRYIPRKKRKVAGNLGSLGGFIAGKSSLVAA